MVSGQLIRGVRSQQRSGSGVWCTVWLGYSSLGYSSLGYSSLGYSSLGYSSLGCSS